MGNVYDCEEPGGGGCLQLPAGHGEGCTPLTTSRALLEGSPAVQGGWTSANNIKRLEMEGLGGGSAMWGEG